MCAWGGGDVCSWFLDGRKEGRKEKDRENDGIITTIFYYGMNITNVHLAPLVSDVRESSLSYQLCSSIVIVLSALFFNVAE